MVDSLARAQRDLLEGASDEARVKLREWELPEALNVRPYLLAQPMFQTCVAVMVVAHVDNFNCAAQTTTGLRAPPEHGSLK